MIENNRVRATALIWLGMDLAKSQQWEQTEAVCTEATIATFMIEEDRFRAVAMLELGTVLVQVQQLERARILWKQAEEVAHKVEEPELRVRILKEIIETLETAGEKEQMLHLVQRSWRLVETRTYAIELLVLALGLIPLKPEIGIDFYEAFPWVDTFFKG